MNGDALAKLPEKASNAKAKGSSLMQTASSNLSGDTGFSRRVFFY